MAPDTVARSEQTEVRRDVAKQGRQLAYGQILSSSERYDLEPLRTRKIG